ncbi:inner spore coat protein CotNE [Bacillus inaquosorum]|uniref:inner spore coat protein CotNE n=1 Tax=Bacillus inaquosorum TaxID=483913 RepID=UPI003D01AE77
MNPYQYYSPQLPQQEPYYSHYEYNSYPQQDVYDPYQMDRQPALVRRIAALERQNEQQSRELTRLTNEDRRQNREIARIAEQVNQLSQAVERHTRRLNRLNQRLRTVENRLNIPFTAGEGGF